MELSTYFRINAANTGQFERTLIVAEADSYVSYLEGCTAPMRDENQLHAAVVEIVALDNADASKKATASADNLRAQIKDYLEDSARARMEVDVARREVERLNREISELREKLANK